jgi:hypothetical protein
MIRPKIKFKALFGRIPSLELVFNKIPRGTPTIYASNVEINTTPSV